MYNLAHMCSLFQMLHVSGVGAGGEGVQM